MDDIIRVPKPMANIGCQDLLTMDSVFSGWLRYRLQDGLRDVPIIGSLMKKTVYKMKSRWVQLYVIIQRGCVYVFNKDTSTKPRFAISLFEYHTVCRAQDEFKQPGLHALKLIHVSGTCRYFSASSDSERKTWMSHLNKSMREANNKQSISESIRRSNSTASGSSYSSTMSELEEPIYDRREMGSMRNHAEIGIYNEDIYDDSGDLDEEEESDEVTYEPDQKDTLATNLNNMLLVGRSMPPLPETPAAADDMPMDPAPIPPESTQKKSIQGLGDRPLPQLPGLTSPYLQPQSKWDTLPSPGADDRSPKSPKLLPGAVQVFMPQNPLAKPQVPKKPENVQRKGEDECAMATWEGEKNTIKTKLQEIAKEGVFAIRDSENVETGKVLVVFVDGDLKQYKMRCENGKWYLFQEKQFENMTELLIYYKRNYLPNTSSYLTKPFRCYAALSSVA